MLNPDFKELLQLFNEKQIEDRADLEKLKG